MSQQFKSYGNFVQTRAGSSSLLEVMPSAADVLQISCKREQKHQVYLNVLPSAAEILRRRQKPAEKLKGYVWGDMMALASPLRVGTRLKQG